MIFSHRTVTAFISISKYEVSSSQEILLVMEEEIFVSDILVHYKWLSKLVCKAEEKGWRVIPHGHCFYLQRGWEEYQIEGTLSQRLGTLERMVKTLPDYSKFNPPVPPKPRPHHQED